MNKNIMRGLGFEKEMDAVEQGLCPFCFNKVDTDKFRDNLSKREFEISGLCQGCQDETFGKVRRRVRVCSHCLSQKLTQKKSLS